MAPRVREEVEEEEDEYEEYEEGEFEEEEDVAVEEEDEEEEEAGRGLTAEGADDGEDEEDEDDEEEEEEEVAAPWAGLKTLPERAEVLDMLAHLRDQGKRQLTVLLLGKSGVGKSSTVNTLLGEQAARVSAFKLQADTEITTPFLRAVDAPGHPADGFRFKLIDTCGLEDPEAGDSVNYAALHKIAKDIKGQPVDVVLYVDRLDLYRVEPLDKGVMRAVADVLGAGLWKRTALVLSHGNLEQTPPGTNYDSFADQRIRMLRGAVRGVRLNPLFRPRLPAVLVDNSESCPTDKSGHRMLPDSSTWVVELFSALTEMAERGRPYAYKPGMTRRPNDALKWLLPLVAAGQYYAYQKLIKPELDRDYDLMKKVDDRVWSEKERERRRLGIGPPLRPNERDAWRLEQMYEDD